MWVPRHLPHRTSTPSVHPKPRRSALIWNGLHYISYQNPRFPHPLCRSSPPGSPFEELREPAEAEDPQVMAALKINLATRQACHPKKRTKDQDWEMDGKKKGVRWRRGCRHRRQCTRRPWPEQFQPPYFYVANQPATAAVGYIPYCVKLNAPFQFAYLTSTQLVQSWTSGVNQLALYSPVCLNQARRRMMTHTG